MKERTPEETVEVIRALYPRPMEYDASVPDEGYCVGGAVVAYVAGFKADSTAMARSGVAYPSDLRLAAVLRTLNPKLDKMDESNMYARRIIRLNDDKDFDGAWATLCSALRAYT